MQLVVLVFLVLKYLLCLNAITEEKEVTETSVTANPEVKTAVNPEPELRVTVSKILRFVRRKEMKRQLFSESTKELMLLAKVRLRKARKARMKTMERMERMEKMERLLEKQEYIASLQQILRDYGMKCSR